MMNAILTLLLAVNAAAQAPAAPAKTEGAKIYSTKCQGCHAKDGKGNAAMAKMFKLADPAALNLTAAVTKKTDADLVKTVNAGRGKMPSFKGKLKDAEISAVVSYVRTLSAAPKAPAGASK
jgi:cytochrome c6